MAELEGGKGRFLGFKKTNDQYSKFIYTNYRSNNFIDRILYTHLIGTLLIMSSATSCDVFYFICLKCKRTASVPESFRFSVICPYCNSEMKEIITED
jgi:hypothetical protein